MKVNQLRPDYKGGPSSKTGNPSPTWTLEGPGKWPMQTGVTGTNRKRGQVSVGEEKEEEKTTPTQGTC